MGSEKVKGNLGARTLICSAQMVRMGAEVTLEVLQMSEKSEKLKIYTYPSSILRQKARPVVDINGELKKLT
ncbi:MAG: hypothetical protein DRH15_08340, partial [Deltaproteobacteria bacterium]